jgi:hypothetical protein
VSSIDGLSQRIIKIRDWRIIVLENQNSYGLKKPFGLFIFWFVLNSLLWVTCNTLVGFINFGVFGFQSTNNPVGFILGIIVGFIIGLVQWVILSRNFSISPLWILSCIIGFPAHYTLNWIAAAIIMGTFQQFLLRRKLNDSFLWFIALFIALGINGEGLRRAGDSGALICLIAFGYGFPTGLVLAWYKHKVNAKQAAMVQQENM